ncbi:MAG: hypothetical protein E6H10_05120 [Bacteroidetes bacterium]|nr:MAG: hypothetical protein E6H10_05120 [Bacteroidota bacterium]
MKKIVHFFFFAGITISSSAQFETNFSYSMAIPLREMGDNINLTHSAVADIRYHFKKSTNWLWIGTEYGIGVYAVKNQKQLYTFSNGSTTEAKVNFTSNVFNAHAIVGADLMPGKPITPYVVAKGGLSNFFTSVYIADPNDPDGCKPLENRNVFKDLTWSAATGAGLKIAMNKIFKKSNSDHWWLDFSANYLFGGTLSYLNVKHLQEFDDHTNPDSKGYNVSFVNLQTNQVHQHQVAEIFTSKVNQLDLKLGLLVRL